MAEMIPDRLPSHTSQGEKKVFEILQRLPDDYIVYYEPIISNRYPDFVVIAPDLGVIIIEVKGWYPADLRGGDLHDVQLVHRGIESSERHPIRQAREYQHALQDECRRTVAARNSLLHTAGDYQGKFIFPFCHFAVLSNITAKQLTEHPFGSLDSIFPSSRVLTRDQMLAWSELTPDEICAGIRRFFDPFWPILTLSQEQISALRAIIHPEIKIQVQEPDRIAVLDLRRSAMLARWEMVTASSTGSLGPARQCFSSPAPDFFRSRVRRPRF